MSSAPARAPRRAPAGGWAKPGTPGDPQTTAAPKAVEQSLQNAALTETARQMTEEADPTPDPAPAPAPAPAPRSLPPAAGNGPRPAPRGAASAPRAAAAAPSTAEAPRRRLLPTAPTPPTTDLAKQIVFLYGREKVGKSTFASEFDRPLFAMTEPGLKALTTYQVAVDSWMTFLDLCAELAEGGHGYKTLVVDIADNLYSFCSGHMLKQYNVAHESDLDWGKGWSVVSGEFERAVTKLTLQGIGIVLISHAELHEIKTKTSSITRVVPTVAKQARKFLLGLADLVLYMAIVDTAEGERRQLFCRGSEYFDAGSRWPLPDVIDMPEDQTQDYAVFKAEYDAAVAAVTGGAA